MCLRSQCCWSSCEAVERKLPSRRPHPLTGRGVKSNFWSATVPGPPDRQTSLSLLYCYPDRQSTTPSSPLPFSLQSCLQSFYCPRKTRTPSRFDHYCCQMTGRASAISFAWPPPSSVSLIWFILFSTAHLINSAVALVAAHWRCSQGRKQQISPCTCKIQAHSCLPWWKDVRNRRAIAILVHWRRGCRICSWTCWIDSSESFTQGGGRTHLVRKPFYSREDSCRSSQDKGLPSRNLLPWKRRPLEWRAAS